MKWKIIARTSTFEFLTNDLSVCDAGVRDSRCIAEVAVDTDNSSGAAGRGHTVDLDVALALLWDCWYVWESTREEWRSDGLAVTARTIRLTEVFKVESWDGDSADTVVLDDLVLCQV